MKVRVHPGDERGVGTYRMTLPAAAVNALDVDVEVEVAYTFPLLKRTLPLPGGGIDLEVKAGEVDCDVIVLQRPSNETLVERIPELQKRGIAVVVEVDDDLHAVHARNIATGTESPKLVLKACAQADLVTVTTPALAKRYGSHGRVAVLPNCVPERLLDMERESGGMTVGWAGWVGTHPEDLQTTQGGVATAVRDLGAHFRLIGPPGGVRSQREPWRRVVGVAEALCFEHEIEATGGLEIEDYYQALGTLDVGICPLQDSAFNRAKSRLKVLEMAARGAAVVASARPDYAAMHAEGICVLASDRARSWRSQVKMLLQDRVARGELVGHAQDAIRENHTYETQGWRWAEAWQDALTRRRARGVTRAAA